MALIMSRDPDEWQGSFVVALGALLNDMLSDGRTVDIVVDSDGRRFEGSLHRYTDEADLIVRGTVDGDKEIDLFTIDVLDVERIEVT